MRSYRETSPCACCIRVREPERCDNKDCQLWRKWFLARWARIHAYPRLVREQRVKPMGVNVGGTCYAAPHQVRYYMATDPCCGCSCTPDLCQSPCRARQHWAKVRQEVMQ